MGVYVDIPACMQVIGSVYNNPSLLDDEKLFFNEDDFTEKFHKIIFGSIYNLYNLGAKKITVSTIEDYLKEKPKSYGIYQSNNGAEWLTKTSSIVQVSTFQYYYQRMKKMTLLRMYDKNGIDLKWLYDIDNILDVKKKEKQEEWLDNTSIEKIADLVDARINQIRAQYVNDDYSVSVQAGAGVMGLLERLKESPEFGVPLYGPLINTVTRGARLGKFYLQSAATGVGKAIPNDTLIPTPIGWRKVGDIKEGDFLFGQDGQPTKVLKIHPQPHKKDIWEVTFSDGRKAKCCSEHLWEYRYKSHNGYTYRVENTRQIYERAMALKNNFKNSDNVGYRFSVKVNEPVEYELAVSYITTPYTYGAMVAEKNMRIPVEYLLGSFDQRFTFLQGLLDKNGSINDNGTVTFTTSSQATCSDVLTLVRSLGMIGSYSTYKGIETQYVITISAESTLKSKMFTIDEHKIRMALCYAGVQTYDNHVAIIDITPTKEQADMTCFTVDNDAHLFLMNDFIVTHNTRSMIANACYIGCGQMYDTNKKEWIDIGTAEPTLFITTEQDEEEIQTMMIAFLAGVDEEQIIKGIYAPSDWDRVEKAAEILARSPLYIKKLPDFSLEDIEMSIKSGIREHKVQYVFHDYIHTSMKILSEISSKAKVKNLREDNILFMISVRLKDICNQYGIFIMSSTQLNGDYRTAEVLDQNLLRGAKSIADKIDYGAIMMEVTKKDQDALEPLITNNGIPKPAIKISVYKNRRGKYKGIILWCIENRGQCKIEPLFATNYNYEYIEMEDTQIKIIPRVDPRTEPSAF